MLGLKSFPKHFMTGLFTVQNGRKFLMWTNLFLMRHQVGLFTNSLSVINTANFCFLSKPAVILVKSAKNIGAT